MAEADEGAVQLIAGGAAMLGLSVLADSGMEHYRGSFENPAMVLPLVASTLELATNGRQGAGGAGGLVATASHWSAAVVGATGLGFHLYNIVKQPGGLRLNNLFYKAPVGAPAALILSGALGAAAQALADGEGRIGPVDLGSGRALAAFAAVGIVGSVGEAALLHFRGAYHNPAMWLPVAVPPLAAAALAVDAALGEPHRVTVVLLATTAVLGIAGVGFHAYGVRREMGGWRNWRQTLFSGPPLPAPPAFTGLAIAGLGALLLIRRRAHG